jgi:LysR family glycine cleavage system transcriptional activator
LFAFQRLNICVTKAFTAEIQSSKFIYVHGHPMTRQYLPPLNPARAFEATGRLLSISKAAEELAVTPAAVSRQVKALEEYLGVDLFERAHGRLELTSAGARYLSDLIPIFASLKEATTIMRSAGRRVRVLKIRSPATFAVRWLIPRLAGFHKLHSHIDVQLTTSSAPLNFEREGIDGGIQLGSGTWPRMKTQRLVPNELVPVSAPSRKVKRQSGLKGETLLHSMARPEDWGLWLKAAGIPEESGRRSMHYETSLLAYQAAAEGHGVAIAQKALVRKELESGTLVTPFPFVLDRGSFSYYLAWPADRKESDEMRAFRLWLLSQAEVSA